ncbi:MAG: 4Fe-4S dicluster domain-containing protein [Deltaproteobacteria bacterium]|nr:4Fe-4S dicluster domain-containing protein [Deltaproteobacteria bacterium]
MAYFTMAKDTLANLFRKPATRMYPSVVREIFPATRGHIAMDITTCIFCGICQKKCPTGAIKVDRANKTWEIERLACIACASCSDACPKQSLSMENTYTGPVTILEKPKTREEVSGA